MSRKTLLALACVALLASGVPAGAAEPDGGQAVEACRTHVGGVPEAGERACRSVEATTWNLAATCRRTGNDEDVCSRVDGRRIAEANVRAYEASWVHEALGLQSALDRDVALRHALVPGSHNSFNAFAYDPTLSGMDANHVYGITDQLRMDMRSLELDVHWAPSAEADAGDGGRAPILCHGAAAGGVHVGCTLERHLRHGLAEIRSWLDANPDEFLLLYLENALDGDPVAHRRAAEAIESELGGTVFRPTDAAPCAPMPTNLSRADILATGAQVLIVGNCDASVEGIASTWGTWVHERDRSGGTWSESGSDAGDDYPVTCDEARSQRSYDTTFVRYFEGGTWLQAMAGDTGEITAAETRRMVACGVNLFGLDHLVPEDPRLEALVWSWAPDEPSGGSCAYHGPDARLYADGCSEDRPFVCADGDTWLVTARTGPWHDGDAACGELGAAFAVPRTGWENTGLAAAKDGVEAWAHYRRDGGTWTPGA